MYVIVSKAGARIDRTQTESKDQALASYDLVCRNPRVVAARFTFQPTPMHSKQVLAVFGTNIHTLPE